MSELITSAEWELIESRSWAYPEVQIKDVECEVIRDPS